VAALIIATGYIPRSPRPEKTFLRLLRRFFRSCEYLVSTSPWDPQRSVTRLERWKETFHAHEVANLPGKLVTWGSVLSPQALGSATQEQVQILTTSLQALAFRMQELIEARGSQQSELLVRELVADVRSWRVAVEEIFGRLSEKPQAAENASLRSRLDAKLTRLEARIDEAFDQADEASVSVQEGENLYRLLGAHRGVSEALVNYIGSATVIDWKHLEEARF